MTETKDWKRIEILPPPKKKPTVCDEANCKLNPALFQLPFFLAVVGPRNSGKTNWVRNIIGLLINEFKVFKKENVIIYKPTAKLDHSLDDLKIPHMFGKDTNVHMLIDEIYRQQEEYNEEGDRIPVLLVLDDITLDLTAWHELMSLGVMGRHQELQIIFIAHKLSSIPRIVRTQCQQFILFRPFEESEREWVLKTFSTNRIWHIWTRALNRAWNEEYSFIYIDFERHRDDVYHAGFHDPLFTPEEEAQIKIDLEKRYNQRQAMSRVTLRDTVEQTESEPPIPTLENRKRKPTAEHDSMIKKQK